MADKAKELERVWQEQTDRSTELVRKSPGSKPQ